LALEVVEVGVEDLKRLAVGCGEVVAGGVGVEVEDAGCGRCSGGAVFVLKHEFGDVLAGHRGA
jgi:hypothetical protein